MEKPHIWVTVSKVNFLTKTQNYARNATLYAAYVFQAVKLVSNANPNIS